MCQLLLSTFCNDAMECHAFILFCLLMRPACSVRFKYCGRSVLCTLIQWPFALCLYPYPTPPHNPWYVIVHRAAPRDHLPINDQINNELWRQRSLFHWNFLFSSPVHLMTELLFELECFKVQAAMKHIHSFYGVVIYGQSTLFENGLLYFYLFEWTPNH